MREGVELNLSFYIEEKKYCLFVERKIFRFEVYVFQELESGLLSPVNMTKISVSTIADNAKYWLIGIGSKFCQKVKKKSSKSRCCNSRDGAGGNVG